MQAVGPSAPRMIERVVREVILVALSPLCIVERQGLFCTSREREAKTAITVGAKVSAFVSFGTVTCSTWSLLPHRIGGHAARAWAHAPRPRGTDWPALLA